MIITEFPNLEWLKKQIETRFQNRLAWGNKTLTKLGWPNVIINTKTSLVHRPNIRGTLSLFTNISGISHCAVDKRYTPINQQFYFLSNQEQDYTLGIENQRLTETFNIHFGEDLLEEVYQGLLTPADKMLGNHFERKEKLYFFNQLYFRDLAFNQILQNIYQAHQLGNRSPLFLEEQLTLLLTHLLHTHRQILKKVERLPSVKSSTKIEIYQRLSASLDYLHTYSAENMDLETLAQTACMSKFHFLRLFKTAFQQSPYQYLQKIRLEKAQILLQTTQLPIHEIATKLGFENSSSFSRLFFQRMKVYPNQYRMKR